jgi:Bifunctional DNA primase/polymerase, N-terminal
MGARVQPDTQAERRPLHRTGAPDARSPGLTITELPDTRRYAIAAAERGWAVFPCRPDDKRPAVDKWHDRACSDPERVARFFPQGYNIGIDCWQLVVLDLDSAAHGELPTDWQLPGITDGRDVFAQLCEWAGHPWPQTYSVATPSGGWHLYFAGPPDSQIRNTTGKIGPLIDSRGPGGYVLGAGSVIGGHAYEVIDESEPVPLPAWLARLLTSRPERVNASARRPLSGSGHRRLAAVCKMVEDAPQGHRNATLYWAACRGAEVICAREADPATVTDALISAAATAGLSEAEARGTVASGLQGGAQ